MEKVRLGIIGIGAQGTTYAGLIFQGMVPHMELGAICDISREAYEAGADRIAASASMMARFTGASVEDVEQQAASIREKYAAVPYYTDYIEMMESGNVDAVVTTVPHYLHPVMGIEAIRRGMPVICEKPAGVYTKQVRQLNETAAAHPDVPFAIMFNQRNNPLYRKLKEIMDSGELGELRRVNWIITTWWRPQSYYNQSEWRATWGLEGGGVLVNQAPHQLDLIQWLCGKPKTVYANIQLGCHRDIAVENEVTAMFEYPNGATGVLVTCTHDILGTDRLEIFCDKGKIIVENSQKATVKRMSMTEQEASDKMTMADLHRLTMGNAAGGGNSLYTEEVIEFPSQWGGQHAGVLENFALHMIDGTPLIAPGSDGINGVALADAILLSGWTGKKVDYDFDEDLYIEELNKRIAEEGKYALIEN
ncbi:MAG: Gfo/Idh/MocA family oxidoreductase [Oscillospiraceae bacterium]|nr:Gfo/Idh/MocA family oxidoreductase [Oscillospiraceae bacterium]